MGDLLVYYRLFIIVSAFIVSPICICKLILQIRLRRPGILPGVRVLSLSPSKLVINSLVRPYVMLSILQLMCLNFVEVITLSSHTSIIRS